MWIKIQNSLLNTALMRSIFAWQRPGTGQHEIVYKTVDTNTTHVLKKFDKKEDAESTLARIYNAFAAGGVSLLDLTEEEKEINAQE